MDRPAKISVLIPVYNVAPYVGACLQSICSQTLKDLEIICADDASTDESASIVKEWMAKDSRIRLVSAPVNGGISRTRNLLMKHAGGEFLMMVDSDDWLEVDALERMYVTACSCHADRLVCGYRYYYEDEPDREDFFLPGSGTDADKSWIFCTPDTIGKVHHGTNGLMIRRSVVEACGRRFPGGLVCEDMYFHYVTYPFCKRASIVREPLYVYRKRAGSITEDFTSGYSLKSLDYVKVALLILEAWKEDGLIEEYRTAFLKMLVMSVRNVRKYAPHSEQKDVTRTVCRVLREEGLYRPQEDDGRLTAREAKLLKSWLAGKSELGFSYYWKKMRKRVPQLFRH